MYHYVRDLKNSAYPEIKGLEMSDFRKQISFIKEKLTPVRMEEVIDAVYHGSNLPENAALLTFDDGYKEHCDNVLPILQEEKMQGSFFISGKPLKENVLLEVNKLHFIRACSKEKELFLELCRQLDYYRGAEFEILPTKELFQMYRIPGRYDTAEMAFVKKLLQTGLEANLRHRIVDNLFQKYVGASERQLADELYLSEREIRKLKDAGMYIGVHGYSHEWLGNLSKEDAGKDINKALEVLEPYIESQNWVMNYPYGSYNEDVIQLVKQKGAKLGLSVVPEIAVLERDNLYKLPRLDTNDLPPKGNFIC